MSMQLIFILAIAFFVCVSAKCQAVDYYTTTYDYGCNDVGAAQQCIHAQNSIDQFFEFDLKPNFNLSIHQQIENLRPDLACALHVYCRTHKDVDLGAYYCFKKSAFDQCEKAGKLLVDVVNKMKNNGLVFEFEPAYPNIHCYDESSATKSVFSGLLALVMAFALIY